MGKVIKSLSQAQTQKSARLFSKSVKQRPWLILLVGPVGAGKTEWVKGFTLAFLGSDVVVSSPSYSLMNVYKKKRTQIFHFDFYRLNSVDDLESLGFWDCLVKPNIVIVEWGELLPFQWPKGLHVNRIEFRMQSKQSREIEIYQLS